MGAVKSTLAINDGMTPALRHINKAMSLMLNNFNAVQRASGNAIDTKDLAIAKRELGKANDYLDEIEQNYEDVGRKQDAFNSSVSRGSSAMGGLWNKLKGVAAAYVSMQGAKSLFSLSDTKVETQARLNLILDDKNTIDTLEAKIRASAERSRGSYQTTADAVGKLGLQAGKAFSSNDELIAFTELLNKSFVVAGTSAQGVDSVMLQMTQAMAAGKLQGEELNAILDNAQPIVANIQRYLEEAQGIDASNIKELASEGVITADVIKNAMFYCSDDINSKFSSMPRTWGQIWISMKDKAIKALNPLLIKIGKLADNPKIQSAMDSMVSAFVMVGNAAAGAFEVICNIYNFISTNWSWIGPIIMGIVMAMLLYNAVTGISSIVLGIMCAMEAAKTTGTVADAIATGSAAAAQTAFNTALWACPLTWIIALIIALIVVFVIFTEQVVGAVFWLGSLFKNVGLWIANCGLAAWQVIKNVGLWFANLGLSIWQVIKNIGAWFGNLGQSVWAVIQNVGAWFGNLGAGIWAVLKAAATNIGVAFNNAWIGIQQAFWTCIDAVMQGLKSLAKTANKCLGWMGVNIDTSGFDFAKDKIKELESKKDTFTDIGDAWAEAQNTFEYKDVGDAFDTYDYGSVGDAMGTFDYGSVGDAFDTFDTFESGWGSDAYNAGAEVGAGINDWLSDNLSLDGMMGKLGSNSGDKGISSELEGIQNGITTSNDTLSGISDDTTSLSDSVDTSSEELEYLRDIAEREAVNRFTTAEVKVDFNNNNSITSDVDVDGVISRWTEEFKEAVSTAAEGDY